MTAVAENSTTIASYEYDSSSRLLQRVADGVTTKYTWDGWDLVKEEKTGAVTETTRYAVPQGGVQSFVRNGSRYYLHGDGLSSSQLVTDSSGNIAARIIYDAWGNELYASDSVPNGLDARFVGGLGVRKDPTTGLIYMRHRWYDPVTLKRFLSRDPIGFAGGTNLYSYTTNPVSNVDPSGLASGDKWDLREWNARTKATTVLLKKMLAKAGMSEWNSVVDRVLKNNKVLWGFVPGDPKDLGYAGDDGFIYINYNQRQVETARLLFHEILHKFLEDDSVRCPAELRAFPPESDGFDWKTGKDKYKPGKSLDDARLSSKREHLWVYLQADRMYVNATRKMGIKPRFSEPVSLLKEARVHFADGNYFGGAFYDSLVDWTDNHTEYVLADY